MKKPADRMVPVAHVTTADGYALTWRWGPFTGHRIEEHRRADGTCKTFVGDDTKAAHQHFLSLMRRRSFSFEGGSGPEVVVRMVAAFFDEEAELHGLDKREREAAAQRLAHTLAEPEVE